MIYVSKPRHNRIKDVKTHHELRKLVGEAKNQTPTTGVYGSLQTR